MYLRLLISLLFFSSLVNAQSGNEGIIVYSVKPVEGSEAPVIDSKNKNELVYTFKGQKSRLDLSYSTGSFSFISDNSSGQAVKIEGKNVANVGTDGIVTFQDCEVKESKNTGEKKTIAGVSCTKSVLVCYHPSKDYLDDAAEVWIAESLKLPAKPQLIWAGMNGVPLEFDFKYGDNLLHMTATKVEMKAVNADLFIFPKETPPMENQPSMPVKMEEKVMDVK